MTANNTLRATVLAALIAVGTTVSSEAATAANPLLSLVQVMVFESAEVVSSIARRGIEAMSMVFRAP